MTKNLIKLADMHFFFTNDPNLFSSIANIKIIIKKTKVISILRLYILIKLLLNIVARLHSLLFSIVGLIISQWKLLWLTSKQILKLEQIDHDNGGSLLSFMVKF